MKQPKYSVVISKTADGSADYMQILSLDQFSVNVVLIADQIELEDKREETKRARTRRR